MKVGDEFLKVNSIDVTQKSLDEISSMIKGGNSKEIILVLKRGEEEITKKVKTALASIPSVTSEIHEKNDKKIGYLYLNIFAQNTDEQFAQALAKLEKEGIDGLIIDVRSNSGGHLESVTNILELLLDKGQYMYQIKSKSKIEKYKAEQNDEREINYKIVVLVDGASASASEVLASALKEQKNAEIIGTTTYGKGTVQKTMNLANGGMIKYTSESWLTSKGNSIEKTGIKPTIELSLAEKYYETYSKEDDNQFNKALEILTNE